MKFKIKYADQIVGFFSLLALAALMVLIFAIGVNKNWFAKKNYYFTVFDSGSGIAVGMDLTYKGFSIGKVESVNLVGEFVKVDYYVLEEYFEYVKEFSVVELSVSPIGLGSSFTLYSGTGDETIPSGREIFRTDSIPGKKFIADGLVKMRDSSDSISVLLGKVSNILDDVHELLTNLNNALEGSGESPFTEIIANLNELTSILSDTENGAVPNLLGKDITKNLTETLASLNNMVNSPEGAVPKLLGKEISGQINEILGSISPILSDVNDITGKASPEVGEMLVQVNTLLLQLEDLMTGLNNNPLIRGGIPDRSNENSATVNIRSSDF
ncbi:MAG: hypothetical protein K6B43_08350 [Treponema sp.]|nr:hypothetical protein [Treponema sp.]